MRRRDFLQTGVAAAVASTFTLESHGQARPKDVLVAANEFGPNSLDIHTVGANRPSSIP